MSVFLAALCKETAMVLPVILIAYEALLRSEKWDRRRVGVRLQPFVGAAVLYLALRVHAPGGFAPTAGGVPLPPARYAATVLALFAGHVKKLVWPLNLNLWSEVSPPESLASPAAAQALGVLGAGAVVAWFAARHSRLAVFAMVLIPLLPAFHLSALNQRLENALAERYL